MSCLLEAIDTGLVMLLAGAAVLPVAPTHSFRSLQQCTDVVQATSGVTLCCFISALPVLSNFDLQYSLKVTQEVGCSLFNYATS